MAAVLPSRIGFRGSVTYAPETGRSGCRSKSGRKKQSPPEKDGRRCGSPMVMKFPVRDPVMGQVKILQRGEELKVSLKELGLVNDGDSGAEILKLQKEDVVQSSTELMGPEPEKEVPRQLKEGRPVVGLYAGGAEILKLRNEDVVESSTELMGPEPEKEVPRQLTEGRSVVGLYAAGAEILKLQNEDVVESSTELMGPEPEKEVPRQLKAGRSVVGLYAGLSCHASPSPKSLPFPGFLKKKTTVRR